MWDDEINKKIKDAADQYHPAYDETAWDKMELLLNEHLPVENKKKKRYFLILLIALLAGGSLFIVYKQTAPAPKTSQKTASKNNAAATQLPQQKLLSGDKAIDPLQVTVKPANTIDRETQLNRESEYQQGKNFVSKVAKDKSNKAFINATGKTPVNKQGKTNTTITAGAIEKVTDAGNTTLENTATDQQKGIEKENTPAEKETTVVNAPDIKEAIATAKKDTANSKEIAKKGDVKKTGSNKKSTKTNKSFGNNFAIGFSAGPDVSSVAFNKTGRIAINYGAGLNYSLSARFTLRSGFYVSEKIYSAAKSEYRIPLNSLPNSNYLYDIDANCKVYEIPLTVSYNFSKNKDHQWFVSAGLSSYLMKKESYAYNYKYPSGNIDSKFWSISNQNQNYFSVLDLSGGYEYSFSKRTSLLTEPYLKIPLSGIGAGKVKLNSGGVLFTFIVKPFYKK